MHAHGKDPGFIPEYTGSAIALVYIQINDNNLSRQLFPQLIGSSYRHVIDQTKSLAPVSKCMVRATGNIE